MPSTAHGPSSAAPCCGASPAPPPDVPRLEDHDLLDLLLAPVREDGPGGLAAGLLARFGGLAQVLGAEPAQILAVEGAGPEAATLLQGVRELAVRLARAQIDGRPVISSWSQLIAYVRASIAHLPREQFRALYLDRRNILMREELVADGTVDHAPVYPREVVRRALELSASAMILVHNHPSGDPTPSRADIEMTRKVVDAARLFGLQVHDHIVVGREGTASFRAMGLI
ncbi:MAG: DNA repair protein RadC [Brevundimonas sp.]